MKRYFIANRKRKVTEKVREMAFFIAERERERGEGFWVYRMSAESRKREGVWGGVSLRGLGQSNVNGEGCARGMVLLNVYKEREGGMEKAFGYVEHCCRERVGCFGLGERGGWVFFFLLKILIFFL